MRDDASDSASSSKNPYAELLQSDRQAAPGSEEKHLVRQEEQPAGAAQADDAAAAGAADSQPAASGVDGAAHSASPPPAAAAEPAAEKPTEDPDEVWAKKLLQEEDAELEVAHRENPTPLLRFGTGPELGRHWSQVGRHWAGAGFSEWAQSKHNFPPNRNEAIHAEIPGPVRFLGKSCV